MGFNNILSILSILLFIPYFLLGDFKGQLRRAFLVYVLSVFPLLDLFIIPMGFYGGLRVFHLLMLMFLGFVLILGEFSLLKFSSKSGFVFFLLFIPVLVVGAVNSSFIQDSLIQFFKYALIFIYAKLLIDEGMENPEFVNKAIFCFKLACLISLVFLLAQMVVGLDIALYDLNQNVSQFDALTRYPSFFSDAQIFGQFLTISSVLFLISFLRSEAIYKSYVDLLFFVLAVFALFLTGSRAAFLGLVLSVCIIFIFSNATFRKYTLIGLGVMVGFALVFYEKFALFNRESDITSTADTRYFYWEAAVNIFSDFPLLGIGVGNYKNYVSLYAQGQYWDFFGDLVYIDHPENGYLKILVEIGLVGFILFCAFLLKPLALSLYSFGSNQKRNPIIVVLFAAVLSWMVAFITVYSFNDIRILILVISLVCLLNCELHKHAVKS